jgi:hypothetical protein
MYAYVYKVDVYICEGAVALWETAVSSTLGLAGREGDVVDSPRRYVPLDGRDLCKS